MLKLLTVDIEYNPANAAWFNPHIRFLAVVTNEGSVAFDDWTLFIVGSDEFDSRERVLQAASWDVAGQMLRFYGVCQDKLPHERLPDRISSVKPSQIPHLIIQ